MFLKNNKTLKLFIIKQNIYPRRYYGLGLWFPELFNRFENHYKSHPNSSMSVCELIDYNHLTNNATINFGEELPAHSCSGLVDTKVFINTLIINAVCLLGNLTSGYFASRVGRRTMPGKIQ